MVNFLCLPVVPYSIRDIPCGSTVTGVAVISSLGDQVLCLNNLSEYTSYCDHACGRPKNYSAGLN